MYKKYGWSRFDDNVAKERKPGAYQNAVYDAYARNTNNTEYMGYMLLGAGGIIAAPLVLPMVVEGAVFVSPYVANGAVQTGRFAWGIAKTYHSTIGINGGYANVGLNWLNQSYTSGGAPSDYFSFEGKSITGLILAGSLRSNATIGGQVGIADPWLSVNYSKHGFIINGIHNQGPKKTAALSIMGAFGPLYKQVPLLNDDGANFMIEQLFMSPGQKAITIVKE